MKNAVNKISIHLLKQLYTYNIRGAVINILSSIYIYLFLAATLSDTNGLLLWLSMVVLLSFIRVGVSRYITKTQSIHIMKKMYWWFVIIVFINGLLWGSLYPLYYGEMNAFQQLLTILILLGGITIAVISLGPSRLCYYAFTIPVTVSILYVHLFHYSANYYFYNIGLIIYLSLLFYMHYYHYRSVSYNFSLLSRQSELIYNLKIINDKLEKASITDALTGLYNRGYFSERLATDWAMCQRASLPLALLIIDVDYFKEYNDAYGHLKGDECLQKIAAILEQTVERKTDLASRFGGDELAVILYDTDEEGAVKVAKRITAMLKEQKIPHSKSPKNRVTISVGIAVKTPEPDEVEEKLLIKADRALYTVKEAGRDDFAVYHES